LADINDFAAFNEVYARMMPKTGAPSRSAVGIAALPKGAKVEIEAIAPGKISYGFSLIPLDKNANFEKAIKQY
jgi:hypothetical protein